MSTRKSPKRYVAGLEDLAAHGDNLRNGLAAQFLHQPNRTRHRLDINRQTQDYDDAPQACEKPAWKSPNANRQPNLSSTKRIFSDPLAGPRRQGAQTLVSASTSTRIPRIAT